MYLLKFEPILKQTLWGGDRIVPYKGLAAGPAHVGESWELSGVRGNESVVANGPWAGTTLPALIAREKGALVGDSVYARFGEEFPLLIKFIDAREDLSIQVHPNDALARRRHGSQGKTEMWYVVDAAPGARLRSGFARPVTPDEYEASVANDTVTQILREYEVRRGDLFFLPAGRVHSIGAGSFIAEIQQTSDITYRIYDFNRKGPDGKTRELHTELAKEAIDYTVLDDYRTRYAPEPNRAVELVSCPYFTTELYELDRPCACDLAALDSFLAVICTDGEARLTADGGEPLSVHAGETVLVPAAVRSRGTPAHELHPLTPRHPGPRTARGAHPRHAALRTGLRDPACAAGSFFMNKGAAERKYDGRRDNLRTRSPRRRSAGHSVPKLPSRSSAAQISGSRRTTTGQPPE